MTKFFIPIGGSILAVLLLIFSCRVDDDSFSDEPITKLEGHWKSSALDTSRLFLDKNWDFVFKRDSVYLQIYKVRQQAIPGDTCFIGREQTDYAMGQFDIIDDTLKIVGVYTSPKYRYKGENCPPFGQYRENFLLKWMSDSTIILKDLSQHFPAKRLQIQTSKNRNN